MAAVHSQQHVFGCCPLSESIENKVISRQARFASHLHWLNSMGLLAIAILGCGPLEDMIEDISNRLHRTENDLDATKSDLDATKAPILTAGVCRTQELCSVHCWLC